MTEPSPSSSRRGARTFRGACIVLATVAAAQAATTALSSRTVEPAAPRTVVIPPEQPKPSDPFSESWATDDPHPEMLKPAGDPPPNDPALAHLNPEPVVTVPKRAAPLDVPITDAEVLQHLDEGLHLRGDGDMLGAVTHLRAALNKMPNHPKLLYHNAQTLDMMGQSRKAIHLWRSLYHLGLDAGDFYILAQKRIADGPQVFNEPDEEKEEKFTVLDLKEKEMPDNTGGERVRFTAVVRKNTTEAVDVNKDMVLAIHFFDTVNGKHVARSQVQQPVVTCTSQPPNQLLDWADGTETFTFDYWQPDMSPEQVRKYGLCKYFGCTLEVFYKDQLQDSAGTTPVVLSYARELPLPPAEPSNSILDSTPGAPGSEPEPSLFPPVLKP
jgi:hypothetical protein